MEMESTKVEDMDLDLDKYKDNHESVEHWQLRKSFMMKNRGRVCESRLVCLSKVFSNVEFMGCKYPQEVMDEVAEFSVGIIEDYRNKRKSRLQRTFVKASDAAERKTKRLGSSGSHSNIVNASSVASVPASKTPAAAANTSLYGNFSKEKEVKEPDPVKRIFSDEIRKMRMEEFSSEHRDLRFLVLVEHLWLGEEVPLQILNQSCGSSKVPIQMEYQVPKLKDVMTECIIKIGKSFKVAETGPNKDAAKNQAAMCALYKLRKFCFTLQIKEAFVSAKQVNKSDLGTSGKSKTDTNNAHSVQMNESLGQLGSSNIGFKLMKSLGWDGKSALGKNQDGLLNPIEVQPIGRDRLGLGAKKALNSQIVQKFLLDQMDRESVLDMTFSTEFTSDERKIIHEVCQRLNFKTKSHGKGSNRQLVVSPRIEMIDLVQEILAQKNENAKYKIIHPGNYPNL